MNFPLRTLTQCLLVLVLAACGAPAPEPTAVILLPTATSSIASGSQLVPTITPLPADTQSPTHTPTLELIATNTSVPSPTPIQEVVAVNGTLAAYFLDVGQGDSILLEGPDFTFLIDAGRHNASDVVPHLERIGVESIDLLIGTHPHADHIGQFPQVLERYPVSEVWMSGDDTTTATFERAIDAIAAAGAAYHEPRAGEVFQIGSARVEVLHPDRVIGELNEGSIVIRVVFGDVAFLFTGDAEAGAEQAMLARGPDLRAQILKLGHHGSNTSSSLSFLQAVQPEIAIWSAGEGNSYGHPHQEVIDRLDEMDVTVLGTVTESTIVICTNGQIYKLGDCDFGPTTGATDVIDQPAVQTPVVNDRANLRGGPGTDFEQVGFLESGTPVTPLERNPAGDWIFVQTPDGQQAWIALFLVDNVGIGDLPVRDADVGVVNGSTPTPTPTSTPPAPPVTLTDTPTPTESAVSGACAPGQVNINTASYEDLQRIIHIGPVRAEEMPQLRPFGSVDDMVRINGIAAGRLSDIKSQGLACVD